jgi:hypothetical protein
METEAREATDLALPFPPSKECAAIDFLDRVAAGVN